MSVSCGIPDDHVSFLSGLKNSGFNPKVIYDIGACVLNWTTAAKKIWPDATYIAFEAWGGPEFLYKEQGIQYFIGVLSNQDGQEVKFYQSDDIPWGNSYYREIGCGDFSKQLFHDNAYVMKATHRLDTVAKELSLPLPDLVKIDVQGAEKDVIEGGQTTFASAKWMIVEMQRIEYNEHAPKVDVTLPYIESLGWECTNPLFCNNPGGADGDYAFKNTRL